jgi:hypothetical protein
MYIMARISGAFIILTLMSYMVPQSALSEVIIHDIVVLERKEVMLRGETKGKLFSKGGEVIEFFVDGRSLGNSLSGGDGMAFRQFVPPGSRLYEVTARSGNEKGTGVLLALKKGTGIIFIDAEGSVLKRPFSGRPTSGSQKVIKEIGRKFPIVFLQSGFTGITTLKLWLKENGFMISPVVSWNNGTIFDEMYEKGFTIKAIIGGPHIVQSAMKYHPLAFSFQRDDNAVEVKDWEEIRKRLK